jgi:hypothetical protein
MADKPAECSSFKLDAGFIVYLRHFIVLLDPKFGTPVLRLAS